MMARKSEEEEDEDNLVLRETDRISMSKPFPRKANPEDPESPGSSSSGNNRQDSSEVSVSEGEGSSSEGVLVEHPLHHDQVYMFMFKVDRYPCGKKIFSEIEIQISDYFHDNWCFQ